MKQSRNRVLAVGGGSGGHVTPVLAVVDELASRHPHLELRFWCDYGYFTQAKELLKHAEAEVSISPIFAGKLRRYHGVSFIKQLVDIPTVLKNIRDLFFVFLGFMQSIIKLLRWRPDVVFLKGGFVCLPVGYAAWLLRIPIVIHDSDTHPGMTNRLLARKATAIATGAPLEYYNYPADKSQYVGIPIKKAFHVLSAEEKARTKALFHLPPDQPLVVVTGGGLGAKRINDCMVAIAPELVTRASIVHLSGTAQYKELLAKVPQTDNYKLYDLLTNHMPRLLGAADVVISRAGATTMLELAAVGAAVIIIPSQVLRDQMKNTKVYNDAGAVVVVDETTFEQTPSILKDQIIDLLSSDEKRRQLGEKLLEFAKPQAAKEVANLIEQAGKL